MTIVKQPTSMEEHAYQKQPGFKTRITIGGDAPDGAALLLDGTSTSLHAAMNSDKLTILNFGSCT